MARSRIIGRKKAKRQAYRIAASILQNFIDNGSVETEICAKDNPRGLLKIDAGRIDECLQDIVLSLERKGVEP